MLKWKAENYQLLKGNYGADEEVEKEFSVWISDIMKKQDKTALSFHFIGAYWSFGLEKLQQ